MIAAEEKNYPARASARRIDERSVHWKAAGPFSYAMGLVVPAVYTVERLAQGRRLLGVGAL